MNKLIVRPVRDDIAPVAMRDRICQDLRSRVERGEWSVGEKIPGRAKLAQEYGVDVTTLQRAMSALLSEGVFRADNRRGTFVAFQEDQPGESAPEETRSAQRREIAKSIANNRIAIIGQVKPSPDAVYTPANFWLPAIQSLETELSEEGFVIQFYNRSLPDSSSTDILTMVEKAASDNPAALVIAGAIRADPDIDEVVDRTLSLEVPSVFMSDSDLQYDIDQVYFNHKQFGFLAAQRLLKAGHEQIVFLATYDVPWIHERAEGVRSAFRQYGIDEQAMRILPTTARAFSTDPEFIDSGYEIGRSMVKSGDKFTAVIAANDHIAFGFIKAAEEAGRVAGRHYNIIGFDDDDYARTVSLSTYRPPLLAIGSEAARALSLAFTGRSVRAKIELSPGFIARSSTNPIPGLTPRTLSYHRRHRRE
ncbi:MAG: GntR family transcriptional regulator [Capsulimonadaceae bacterium]|nr:GntR family transcriptional regulator [Capsulimonadaceae bacterium]